MAEREVLLALFGAYFLIEGSVGIATLRALENISRHSGKVPADLIDNYDAQRRRNLSPIVYYINLPGRLFGYLLASRRKKTL